MMKKILILLILIGLSSCELIVLTSKKKNKAMELSQRTPVTTVFLFKSELDSNNIKAASELLLQSNGAPYMAIQKYELFDELSRLKRIIGGKPVTSYAADSLSPVNYTVKMEIDYLKLMTFSAMKVNDAWFITNYTE